MFKMFQDIVGIYDSLGVWDFLALTLGLSVAVFASMGAKFIERTRFRSLQVRRSKKSRYYEYFGATILLAASVSLFPNLAHNIYLHDTGVKSWLPVMIVVGMSAIYLGWKTMVLMSEFDTKSVEKAGGSPPLTVLFHNACNMTFFVVCIFLLTFTSSYK